MRGCGGREEEGGEGCAEEGGEGAGEGGHFFECEGGHGGVRVGEEGEGVVEFLWVGEISVS